VCQIGDFFGETFGNGSLVKAVIEMCTDICVFFREIFGNGY
jgi:hypothetical protein